MTPPPQQTWGSSFLHVGPLAFSIQASQHFIHKIQLQMDLVWKYGQGNINQCVHLKGLHSLKIRCTLFVSLNFINFSQNYINFIKFSSFYICLAKFKLI
jgi:hypothetical protein